MTVYIEYVIIDNLIIDYLMLKATFALTGYPCARGRLFLCALLGAVIALLYPLLEINGVILALVKICSGLIIVLLSAEFSSPRRFYITAVIFFGYTFLLGGAVIGIFSLFGVPYSSEISIALMVIPVYFILRALSEVVKFIYRRKDNITHNYKIKAVLFGQAVDGVGFLDTGNGLYDNDNPVIVCNKNFFYKLAGENLPKIKLKKISVNTVNGKTENPSFNLDKLLIYFADEPNIYNNVTVCVTDALVGECYDVILHPAFLEVNYGDKNIFQTEKVS